MTISITFTAETLDALRDEVAAFLGAPLPAAVPEAVPEPAPEPAKRTRKARAPAPAPEPEPEEALPEPDPEGDDPEVVAEAEAAAELDPAEVRAQFAALAARDYDKAAAILENLGVNTFGEAVAAGLLAELVEQMGG